MMVSQICRRLSVSRLFVSNTIGIGYFSYEKLSRASLTCDE